MVTLKRFLGKLTIPILLLFVYSSTVKATVDPRPTNPSEPSLDQVFKGSLADLKGLFQQLDTTLSKVIDSTTTQTRSALFNAAEQQTQLLLDEARRQAQAALDSAVTPVLAAALAGTGNGGPQSNLLSSLLEPQIPRRRLAQIPLLKKANIEAMLTQMSEVSKAMLSVEAKAAQQELLEKIKDSLRYYGIRIPKTAESRSVGTIDPESVDKAMRAAQDTMESALMTTLEQTIQSMINAANQTLASAVPRKRALLSTVLPGADSLEEKDWMMAEAPAAEARFASAESTIPDIATAVENLQTEVQGMLTAVDKALKAPEKFMKKLFSSVKTAAEATADNVETAAKSMVELSKNFLSQGKKDQRDAVEQIGQELQLRQLKELAQAHTMLSKYRSLTESSPAALASHYRQLAAVPPNNNNNNIDSMDVLLEDLNNNPVEDVVLDVMSEGELVMGVARLLQEVEQQQDAIHQGKLEKGVVVIEMTPVTSVMLLNDMVSLTNELLGFMMMPVPMMEIDIFQLAQAPSAEMEMWMIEESVGTGGSLWPPEPQTPPEDQVPSSPSSYAPSDLQKFRRLLSTFSDKKNKRNNKDDKRQQQQYIDDGYLSEIEEYYESYDSDALYSYDDLYAYREGAFQDDWFFAPSDAVPGSPDDGALLAVVIRAVTPQAGSIGLPPALLQLLLDESGSKSTEQLTALLSAAAASSQAGAATTTSTATELPAYNIFGPKPTTASESITTGTVQIPGPTTTTATRQQSVVVVEQQQQQHHGSQLLPERFSSQARTVAVPHDSTAAGSDLSVKFWAAGVGAGFIGLLIGGIVVAVMSRGGGKDDNYRTDTDTYLLLPSPAEQVLLPPSARKGGNDNNSKDGGEGIKAVGQTPRKLSHLPA